jgi:hypothetical protein
MQFFKLKWGKIGLIFKPGKFDWMNTHAQNPMPQYLGNNIYRVHFACRDKLNRAHGAFFDFNINEPQKTLRISNIPTIGLGKLGCFDDSGVMPSALVNVGEKIYLYYTGWSKTVDVPFSFHIGLATSEDGETFKRYSQAPVLGRNHFDPYITGAPCAIYENNLFKMWYISGTKWVCESKDVKPKHYYTVKYAESTNGVFWQTNGELCLDYEGEEYAIARPVVFKENSGYGMFFTFRGGSNTYRLGAAHSPDGKKWNREPEIIKIEVSSEGWDSEMICYGYPFWHDGILYALYNGNSYGSTGIGLAVAKE